QPQARVVRLLERSPEQLFALDERQLAQIEAVVEEAVEGLVQAARVAAALQRVLQELKVSHAVISEHGHFTVEQRALHGQRAQGAHDRRQARAPVVAAAREAQRAALLDTRQNAVAVELDLVQPLVALGRGARQRRQLRLDEVGQG